MNHLIAPFILASLATAAQALELGPQTPVTLGSTLAVGVVVIGGAFWIGRYMQRLDDKLSDVDRRLTAIERGIHTQPNKK